MDNKQKQELDQWLEKQLKSKDFEKLIKKMIGDAFVEFAKFQFDNRYFIKNRFK